MIEILNQAHGAWDKYVELNAKAETALDEYKELLKPRLFDLSIIDDIYEWCRQVAKDKKMEHANRYGMYQFVFIVLFLYSPKALFGGRIDRSLRVKFASLLGYNANNNIYRLRNKAIAWQRTYKEFSCELLVMYDVVCNNLFGVGKITQ